MDAMEDGALDGMQTFDSELERLVEEGALDMEEALTYATNPTNLRLRLSTQAEEPKEGGAETSQNAAAVGSGANVDDMIER